MSLGLDSASPTPQPFDEADGVTLPTSPEGRPGFLSDVIIELGLAPREVVDAAIEESREAGTVPEMILIQNGAITDEQLAIALAERNGLPYVDLFRFRVNEGAARLIDSETARRYHALPIAVDTRGALVVALADPMDALAVNDIGVITKSDVRTAVASDAGIDAVLESLPETTRRTRLSAHGPDGLASARAAEVGEWTMASISSPESASPLAMARAATPEPPAPPAPPAPEPVAAEPAADLESRIDDLVAAALAKHLAANPAPAPAEPVAAPDVELQQAREELAQTRAELARALEDAEQAQGEVVALSARIDQLEGNGAPAPSPPAPSPPAPEPEPSVQEARLDDHLERVMRELGGRSA